MRKSIWNHLFALSLSSVSALYGQASTSESFTHMNAQLGVEKLTLEIEVLPHMLQKAEVLRDIDGDGKISPDEFERARAPILNYAQKHLGVTLNARELNADSATVTYRLHEHLPARLYITRSYGLLLRPEHLALRNEMFEELHEAHRNYGTLTSGKQILDFAFPTRFAEVKDAEFEIVSGTVRWINHDANLHSPAMLWLGAGLSGLLLFAGMAYARKQARRHARRQKRKQREAMGLKTSSMRSSPRHAYELEKVLS